MVINFVDALPETRRRGPLARHRENKEFAAALRDNPGVYAKYPRKLKDPICYRGRINRGEPAAFGHGFEAEVVNGEMFVKYVGNETA